MDAASNLIGADVQVRSSKEIARRSLALGAVVGVAFGADEGLVRPWLKKSGIDRDLTARERSFVYGSSRTEKEAIYFTWMAEALVVLLWAIRKVHRFPGPASQCSTRILAERTAPFGRESSSRFIATADRRPERVLIDRAFELQQLHAVARQRKVRPDSRPDYPPVDIEIVQERHRSANWVIGYDGLPWEEVTSDT